MNRNAIGFTQVKATLRGAGVSLPDRCQKNTSRTTRNPGIAARSIASHRWCYLDPGSRAIESETLTGDVVVKRKTLVFCSVIAAMSPAVWADSLFDGTWRPEYPQKASPGQKHDITELKNGVYECRSCTPPYTIQADGMDYPVKNNPDYDARNVKIVDAQTITKSVKKGGSVVFESKVTAAADGTSLTELQTIYGMTSHPFVVRMRSKRVGAPPSGSHAVAGEWQQLDFDMPNNDEDTTLKVEGDTLSMSDKMGRSFKARLDGTDAPYSGTPEFTSVSVKLVDSHTIEELDKSDGKVLKITRWVVTPDGKTIHARFDDTHGRIQEQDGHKLP